MKPIVLITGANGMLAKQLAKQLIKKYSVRFLTRKVTKSDEYLWDLNRKYIDPKSLEGVDHIIHLAGSSIAEKSWSENRKKVISSSRIDSSQLILDELKKYQITIKSFISASATGYYGSITSDTIFNEESPKGNDYLGDVCAQWEQKAHLFKSEKIAQRVAIVRIGVVLSANNQVLSRMSQPIKYGVGAAVGTGKQYMPWIHIEDLCGIFKFVLTNEELNETFNAVAPTDTTNTEITKQIAKRINRKIILPNIPKFVIKLLFGEMSTIILEGSRVSPDKIIKHGFNFKYNTLAEALNNIYSNKS